jgi:TP901 family phage tail tape measure protein
LADVNAEINVNIDTSNAFAQLKALQREIARFHTSVSRSTEAASLAQRDLQRNFINGVNAIQGFSAELRTVRTTAENFTDSLERNKFSMREYFRYAGASTRTFGRFFTSEFDTINKVAVENVKRLQTQYIKMGRDANGAMRAIAVMPTKLDMSSMSTQIQIAAQKQAIFNQLVKQGSTNLLNFGKNTQWAGRQLMVGFTIPLMGLGAVATRTFMDMETAAIKFRKVYGDLFTPAEETQFALDSIKSLGQEFTKYGIAVSQTVGLAAEAAAAGFSGADLQAQVTQATRLQVLGQVEQQKALETTISLQNAFRISANELADAINFLNAVENQTVVSLDDISTAIPKAAPIVKELGGDVKDLAFFMAAMKEGGINASEGANALKSGLASLINPTDKAKGMLMDMGINIDQIVESNVGNLKATVIEFAKALDGLSNLQRQRAIEQLFGKFQQARLSALFDNVIRDGNQASRVLDLASASMEDLASLAEKELGITADSAMNKFKKSIEDLKLALAPVGEVFLQIVTPILEKLSSLIEWFNGLSDGSKKAIAKVVLYLGGIAPVLLMTIGLMSNFVANGIKGLMLLRNGFLRLTGQSKILGEQTNYLTVEQQNAISAAASLEQSHINLQQAFTGETAAVRQLITEYQRMVAAQNTAAVRFPGMMAPGYKSAKKFAKGVARVPGPKGAGDVVPAMLSPGEAVIPAKMTQKYGGLINGMISDNIPGFQTGLGVATGVSSASGLVFAHGIAPREIGKEIADALMSVVSTSQRTALSQATSLRGLTNFGFIAPEALNKGRMSGADASSFFGDNTELATSRILKSIYDLVPSAASDPAVKSDVLLFGQNISKELATAGSRAVSEKDFYTHVEKALSNTMKTATTAAFKNSIPLIQSQLTTVAAYGGEVNRGQRGQRLALSKKTQMAAFGYTAGMASYKSQTLTSQIKRSGYNAGNAAVTAVAEGAATKSPSKKTILVGEDIARGLQVGMANQIDETKAMASKLAVAGSSLINPKTGKPFNVQDIAAQTRVTGPQVGGMASSLILPGQIAGQQNLILPGQAGAKPKGLIIPGKPNSFGPPPLILPSQMGLKTPGGLVDPRTGGYFPPTVAAPSVANETREERQSRFGRVRGAVSARFKRTPAEGGTKRRIGRMSPGAGMGLSGLVFALSMLPGKLGQLASAIMPATFALQAMSMIRTPAQAAVAAVAAVGVGLYMLNKSAKETAQKLVDSANMEAEARYGSTQSIQQFAEFTGRSLPSGREFSRNNRQLISASGAAVGRFNEFYGQKDNRATQVINAAAMRGPEAGIRAAAVDVAQRAAMFGLGPADIAANIKSAADLIGADQVKLKAQVQSLLSPDGKDITKEPLTVKARMEFLENQATQNLKGVNASIGKLSKIKLPQLSEINAGASVAMTALGPMGGIGNIRRMIDIGKRVSGGESFKQAATTMSYQELKQSAGWQQGINESYSGGFGSEAMGALKQVGRNALGFNYDLDVVKEFNRIQTSVSSSTMQLSIAFTQQKESLALLNQQYADGTITKEEYDRQIAISSSNFAQLGESSKTLVTELDKIDSSGALSADALKSMGNEAFAALKKSNPELFKKITKSMQDLDGASQIDIMMGYAQGSLTILDVARLPEVLEKINGKTVTAAIKILQEEGFSAGLKESDIRSRLSTLDKELISLAPSGPEGAKRRAELLDEQKLLQKTLKDIEDSKKVNQGAFDTDNKTGNKVASGVGKITDAYDKELEALRKKRDALKDVNSELDRQNQYQMKQMDLINQAARAKISGDFLQAAQLQQQSMFEGAKFARESTELQMDRVITKVENARSRVEDTKKFTSKDKELLAKLRAKDYEGISATPKTPQVGFNEAATGFAGSTTNIGGAMYTVTMNISGENAQDIADKVINKLNVLNNKNNKSNKVKK